MQFNCVKKYYLPYSWQWKTVKGHSLKSLNHIKYDLYLI